MASFGRNFMNQYYKRANNVRAFQELFQKAEHVPVYLRGPSDQAIYKGLMALSFFGTGLAFCTIYAMASGSLKKK